MFARILIANRGEIACRIIESAKKLNIESVAVYSDVDSNAKHVLMADHAYHIGPGEVSQSYLNIEKIIEVARVSGAQAIHPGYGFLSENPNFVEACDKAKLTFIGPSAKSMQLMGLKDSAKKLMQQADVNIVPGYHGKNQDADHLAKQAHEIGFPLMLKARAGGGGKGMRKVDEAKHFIESLQSAKREAKSSFADDHIIIEKFITSPRHIEIQILADQCGNFLYLFERDCSLQRRHQKVIEEAPAPGVNEQLRKSMGEAAIRCAKAVDYIGAGTVEFIVEGNEDGQIGEFFFMEMNTRLQVEHPVTEAITDIDLVDWQIRIAAGESLNFKQQEIKINGHAIEARLYAEDANNQFLPTSGKIDFLRLPQHLARFDFGIRVGDEISPFYDPMLGKVITHAPNRAMAIAKLNQALANTVISGCLTNRFFLQRLINNKDVVEANCDTMLIERQLTSLLQHEDPSDELIALATLAQLNCLKKADQYNPWQAFTLWRHFQDSKQFIELKLNDQSYAITVIGKAQAFEVLVNGTSLEIKIVEIFENAVRIDCDSRISHVEVFYDKSSIVVINETQQVKFEVVDYLNQHESQLEMQNQVTAPTPGVISQINVKAKQNVKKGDVIIIIQAMKMEFSITATKDAIVNDILVKAGERVDEGQPLLNFDE